MAELIFKQAKRLDHFETGIFAALDAKKAELIKAGRKVYNLFVGTPDFAPQQSIMEAAKSAVNEAGNYKYSLRDTEEMLQ